MPSFTKVAGGNLKPSRFTHLSTTNGQVTQATAGQQIYGISGPEVRRPPLTGLDDGYHAIANERALIYGPPEKDVRLCLGGTVTAGDRLKSDNDGCGVTTTTNLDEIGAVAMESGVSGDYIRVQCIGPVQISS